MADGADYILLNRQDTLADIEHQFGNGETEYANSLCFRENLYALRVPALDCIRDIFDSLTDRLGTITKLETRYVRCKLLFRGEEHVPIVNVRGNGRIRRPRRVISSLRNRMCFIFNDALTWQTLAKFFANDYIANQDCAKDLDDADPHLLLTIIKNCKLFGDEIFEPVRAVTKHRNRHHGHATRLKIDDDQYNRALEACRTLHAALLDRGIRRDIIRRVRAS